MSYNKGKNIFLSVAVAMFSIFWNLQKGLVDTLSSIALICRYVKEMFKHCKSKGRGILSFKGDESRVRKSHIAFLLINFTKIVYKNLKAFLMKNWQ